MCVCVGFGACIRYIYMYVYTYTYTICIPCFHLCMYEGMNVCVYVGMQVCTNERTCVYVCIFVYHTHIYTWLF